MNYRELIVLLPCHSLEDFPTYHEGDDAHSLLASWSALGHPALLAAAGQAPSWPGGGGAAGEGARGGAGRCGAGRGAGPADCRAVGLPPAIADGVCPASEGRRRRANSEDQQPR